MDRAKVARDHIKAAMDRPRNGGVYAVAKRAGVHFTQVYAFLRGGNLTQSNAGKLRAAVRGVRADVWADALAPAPIEAPASTTTEAP
jgi:hypothetical protein